MRRFLCGVCFSSASFPRSQHVGAALVRPLASTLARALLPSVALLLVVTTPVSAQVTYSYTGTPFTIFAGPECPPVCRVVGSFTIPSALPANSAIFIEETYPNATFTFTDGATTFSNLNTSFYSIYVETDGQAHVAMWDLLFRDESRSHQLEVNNFPGVNPTEPIFPDISVDGSGFAETKDSPGSWSSTTTPIEARIAIVPMGIDFGFVDRNETSVKRLQVANTGAGGSLLQGHIAASPSPFGVPGRNSAFSIAAGQSRLLEVSLAPTTVGTFTGDVVILSNDPARPRSTVELDGTSVCVANFDVGGFLPGRRQPSESSCWATAASILVSWRDGTLRNEFQVAAQADAVLPSVTIYEARLRSAPSTQGLQLFELDAFLKRLGLTQSTLRARPSVCELANLLKTFGPVWVTTGNDTGGLPASAHAQVITGIHGDGTETGTTLTLVDPDDGSLHSVAYPRLMMAVSTVSYWPQWVHF